MASKRPFSQDEEEEFDGSLLHRPKRSQPCHHCCSLLSEVRRVVQEEFQNIFLKHGFPYLSTPTPSTTNLIEEVARFQLHFDNKLPHKFFSDREIKAEGGMPIQIVIRHVNSNEIISSGPFASLKIRIVALDGEFGADGRGWTKGEFLENIKSERKDRKPLLTGALNISLSNGVGHILDAKFTDNSSWTKNGFKLGAMVSEDSSLHEKVQEAISETFKVKDCRVELNQKDHPPLLKDEVWRLRKIGKNGPLHKKLAEAKIKTVHDFLRSLSMDPDTLRKLLRMPNKAWEATVNHARGCILGNKLYSYSIEEKGVVLVFDDIFQLVGANIDGLYQPLSGLSPFQKELVERLKSFAYKNPKDMDEFHGTLGVTSISESSAYGSEVYGLSVTSRDNFIETGLQQQTYVPHHQVSNDLFPYGYSSMEHEYYFHPSASFQMPDSIRAPDEPIDTRVTIFASPQPAGATSIPRSSPLLIPIPPSLQLSGSHYPESIVPSELSGNQYKDIYSGQHLHCTKQPAFYQANNSSISIFIDPVEQNPGFYNVLEEPITAGEDSDWITPQIDETYNEISTRSDPLFPPKWFKLIAAVKWVPIFIQSAAKRAKITRLSQKILVPRARASVCGI